MDEVVYTCIGTCEAVISEKQFNEGLTSCGTDGCTHQGHPFEKRMRCSVCAALYKEGEEHSHAS